MVYRVYVEKKPGLDHEAQSLKNDLVNLLGIERLTDLRLLNRYDVEGIDEALFDTAKTAVFSEPPLDNISQALPEAPDAYVFAVEYLPGQFDQRADSAAQCIQLISQGERPLVRSARVYLLYGALTEADREKIKKYVINPVESREASLAPFDTLKIAYDAPPMVETLHDFLTLDEAGLLAFVKKYGLAMDGDDLKFCQDYFKAENRCPTLTEIRMLDTYWSDHCRHTTFLTHLKDVQIDYPAAKKTYERYLQVREELNIKKPVTLMDMATIGAKYLKKQGLLSKLDESERADRERPGKVAAAVQERNPQPPHRNRALRRGGHLHRRGHPRSPVRPGLRVRRHARHRRRRPHRAPFRNPARQAAPAQDRHHRRGGLFQLRQPDRPCHRRGA